MEKVANLQAELAYFQAHLATLEGPIPPPPPPPQSPAPPPGLTINDLTSASSVLGAYDLSSLLDPMVVPPSWTMQLERRQMDPNPQFISGGATRAMTDLPSAQGDTHDFHELARELLQRPSRASSGSVPCKTERSPHNG
ncbi:hypothetical protein OSB04_011127 [Centaurea solstitialis]|uniref:Uncharacterized protein n=1 Tax=Centaurea solstitialis TaxID=347529 RepID=A0AA38T8U7_9ASTR|nr:hypothetical protein OSB04_011127 [Centaurea solstitialis]